MKSKIVSLRLGVSLRKTYSTLIFIFLYAPILVLIIFSFNSSKSRVSWEGFTFKWYLRLFQDQDILRALSNTIVIAVVSAFFSTLLGTIAAIGIAGMKKRMRKTIINVTSIPMLSPEIVTGVSLMLLFVLVYKMTGFFKPGLLTLIIAHITFCLPYVILSVLPKLRQIDPNLYEAALDLGCTPLMASLKVILPEIMPGIVTGMTMAFTLSIDDFVISYFVSGTTQTLPIAIYSMTRKIVSPEINALSTILFFSVFILLVLINLGTVKEKKSSKIFQRLFFSVALMMTVITSTASVTSASEKDAVTINVYNWGEYISDGVEGTLNVNSEFTKRTGIKVNYTTFQDNESLFAKLSSGGANYDVIIPSDYMVSKMIDNKMLSKLNFDNIPNFSNVQTEFRNLMYDPTNEYSVPYTWGTVGIFYNKKNVSVDPDKISWDILWDEKYKNQILMFDNSRDAFAIAQIKLGMSVNSKLESDWYKAAEELKRQKPLVQSYVMDQIFDKMGNGEAFLAPYYDGDAKTLVKKNPDIGFAVPKEGTVKFVDAMCIPVTSKHKEEAEKYINFMCDLDITKANTEYIGYSSPCYKVDDEYNDVIQKTQVFANLPDNISSLLDNLWVQVKIGGRNNSIILILVLTGFILLYIGCILYKRSKSNRN